MTISGTMMLTNVSPANGPRNQRGARWRPSAAIVPTIVEMTAVNEATTRLLNSAFWICRSARTFAYHFRLNPCQLVTWRSVALKLNRTTMMIGTYRKT